MKNKITKFSVSALIMSIFSFFITNTPLALGPNLGDGDNTSVEDSLSSWWENFVYIINAFVSILIIIIGISIVVKWITYANAKDDRQSQEAKNSLTRGFIGIAILGAGVVYIIITLVSWGQTFGNS